MSETDYRAGERVEINCTHLVGATVGACAACIAKAIAAAEERGRRAGFSEGVAEAARLTESLCAEFEAEAQRQSESGNSHNATADRYHAFGCERAAMRIRSLAPRDSGKGNI